MAHSEPIADLSYRGYSGALRPASARWRVIAGMGLKMAIKKRSFWVFTAFSGWYYLVLIAILYFVEQASLAGSSRGVASADEFFGRIIWKDQFLHGFSFAQIIWLVLALVVGAGAIANDNRSNALLVYLSKPCTKRDYLMGKWFSVFLPLLVAMAVPTAFFYIYGALNFRERGFLSDDPWLILRMAFMLPVAAAFHASLVVGISSLFNQGRVAGAAYAGAFFLSNFFTQLVVVVWNIGTNSSRGGNLSTVADAIQTAYYFSIDGLLIGWCKIVLDTDGSPYFGIPSPVPSVPKPNPLLILILMAVLSLAALAVAWRRVRAVEVVK